MGLHQHNDNRMSDDLFTLGDYSFLVAGNKCRLLDGRRTPGFIEKIDVETGMFIWRISDFEDKGNSWQLPFSQIFGFQFLSESKRLSPLAADKMKHIDTSFGDDIYIKADLVQRKETERLIREIQSQIDTWIKSNDSLQTCILNFNLESFEIMHLISIEFQKYMKKQGLLKIELKTAENIVLNPNSTEWIKGMKIVLGEMGLADCYTSAVRSNEVFIGDGSKKIRRKYILHRIAFVRSLLNALNLEEPILYRGMASEKMWSNRNRTLLNMTFSKEVAKEFSSFDNMTFKSSYIMRTVIKAENIFMTFIETAQMNERYKESEAVILCTEAMCI